MFFELVGTILAGVAVGLILWAVNRTSGGRLPGWIVPAGAGAAMILAAVTLEYGWYKRSVGNLPEGFIVAEAVEETSGLRPWTYLVPYVSRYVAVDQASIKTHPKQPGQKIVDLVFFGRWARTAKVPVLFDCTGARSADILDGVEFDSDGAVTGATWRAMPADDPILTTACKEV